MNIYDFDGTIYKGDSSKDIVKYGLLHYPTLTYKSIKKARKKYKDYKNNLISFEEFKQQMFSFIFEIPNYPKFISGFVDSHMKKIKPFYLSRKAENDVILSASYDLWVKEFAKRLGVKYVIATRVNSDGEIIGKNCKGEEKVRRFREVYPNAIVSSAFSDSSVDIPMLELCIKSYVVEGNKYCTYIKGFKFKNNK